MRVVETLAGIPDDAWCVLRCVGRATLQLADTLAGDGYEVWTPRETRKIRIPRMNVRRQVVLPLMPSYVFAKAHQLVSLLEAAARSSFSVMLCFGKIPLVADNDLNGLRTLETKLTPRKQAERSFPVGAEVRVDGGSFGGMIGSVQRSDCSNTLVCFNEKYVVKISTSLLLSNELGRLLSYEDDAAQEAA